MRALSQAWPEVRRKLSSKRVKLLLLDFDGTLVGIAPTPSAIRLSRQTKSLISRIIRSQRIHVIVISGRSLKDLRSYLKFKNLVCMGNHGLETRGIRLRLPKRARQARAMKPQMAKIHQKLQKTFCDFPGVMVENKGYTLSLHYRNVASSKRFAFAKLLKLYRRQNRDPVVWRTGKKVWDIRPLRQWGKGDMALVLTKKYPNAIPITVGDDDTDEDMFRALNRRGVSIRVGNCTNSKAQFYVKSITGVRNFLKKLVLLASLLLFLGVNSADATEVSKGLWITCFGNSNTLGSRQGVENAVRFAKNAGFEKLFIQVYRADKAWFNSQIADATPYQKNLASVKVDPLHLLINRAHQEGLQVHAWFNALNIATNVNAPILKKSGWSVLTKDQHGRASRGDKKDTFDRYYNREKQYFLEPGDPRVQQHLVSLVQEIARNYPELDGVHLDYMRYPSAPPYIPGSRFNGVGLTYGYGDENVNRFKRLTGFDPFKADWQRRNESEAWDRWKRDQLTDLLRTVRKTLKSIRSGIQLSSAVVPQVDRAYHHAFQDWALWLDQGLLDFVVIMNYATDARSVRLLSEMALGVSDRANVYIGLGAFLMKDNPENLRRQIGQTVDQSPGGLVLFDYDTIVSDPALRAVVSGLKS
jgi:trehalose 6-phosphate phosphatase